MRTVDIAEVITETIEKRYQENGNMKDTQGEHMQTELDALLMIKSM